MSVDIRLAAQAAEQAAYAAGTHLLASRSRLRAVLFTHRNPAVELAAIEVEAEEVDRNPSIEIDLYRIVREALDNVALHSAAEHAVVRIARPAAAATEAVG